MVEIYKLIKNNENIEIYLPKVLKLFKDNYKQYHYLEELEQYFKDKSSKLFVGEYNNKVVGFGILKFINSHSGLLSSLLVDEKFRNLGIGKQIDELRFREYLSCEDMNSLYASCVETSISNQKLKEVKEMSPISFRYCYRKGIRFESQFGHSILYYHSKLNWKNRKYTITTKNKKVLNILFDFFSVLDINNKNILVQERYQKKDMRFPH